MSIFPTRRSAWTQHGTATSRPNRFIHVTALVAASVISTEGASSDEGPLLGREFAEVSTAETTPRISFFKSGNPAKQRVIFVHGTPGSAGAWTDYLQDHPDNFEYVAVDRPGFGKSAPDQAVVTLREQALALENLLVEREGQWPILVGHSLGAPIIAKLAVLSPQKVGGLIFVSGSFDPTLEKIHLLQRLGDTWPIERILPSSIRNSNRELFALKAELEILETQLSDIPNQITIIHGTRDNLVPYENVQYVLSQLVSPQSAKVVTLEGKNHFLPWNSKDIIEAAIKSMAAPNTSVESLK
jgi:pimeloyl-ACP methyl ester carboxylesterase